MSSQRRLKVAPELRGIFWIWLVLSVIAVPLVIIFVGPALPPGSASDAAHGQQQDNTVMLAIVVPIMIGLLLYFINALVRFRSTDEVDALGDGPAMKGDPRVMVIWIAATFVIVLFLAAWGAYELFPGEAGAGGGLGSAPISVALPANASSALPVQVIGQQWAWTYRYPTYGGLETTELVLPVGQEVRFSVTSIDVIHSFWAVNLAVKADAVPGVANVAFVKPVREEASTIRCAELCGLWHGHMTSRLRVVSPAAFRAWIAFQRVKWAPIQRYLPPYKPTYAPEPSYRAE